MRLLANFAWIDYKRNNMEKYLTKELMEEGNLKQEMHSAMLKIQGNRFMHYYKSQSTHIQKPKKIYEQTI